MDLEPTLIQHDLTLTSCFCKDPISKEGRALRLWGGHEFLRHYSTQIGHMDTIHHSLVV